jgi:hypothetical protein
MSEWRDISTAEKVPGMRVLLADDMEWVFIGWWLEGQPHGPKGCWMTDDGDMADSEVVAWMPLPDPPHHINAGRP